MRQHLLLFACVASIGTLLAGCGDEDQPSEQATEPAAAVGDQPISEAMVAKNMNVIWPMSEADGGRATSPPRFKACVATRKPDNARERDFALRGCREIYRTHMYMAVSDLIQLAWSKQAAAEAGITITRADARRLYDRRLRLSPPDTALRAQTDLKLRRTIMSNVVRVERDRLIAESLGVAPEVLMPTLGRRYAKQTRCAKRYRTSDVPECIADLDALS